MAQVDAVMVGELGIGLIQMMENAGRSLAEVAITAFSPASVTVLAGTGGNGGGGLVAARHLANRGVDVRVALTRPSLEGEPGHQLGILHRMKVPVELDPPPSELLIDALIGYSIRGHPRGVAAELIEWANGSGTPILSLDTPSGLHVTTGEAMDPCIEADVTLTVGLPKVGLRFADQVGRLLLADISVPPQVYAVFGMDPTGLFERSAIVEIHPL